MHSSDAIVLPAYETLQLSIDGPIALITLNRPQVLNALNAKLLSEIDEAVCNMAVDPSVRVIRLTGAGEKAFAAGADIAELAALDSGSGEAQARRAQGIFGRIETCGKPVIACINGFALGGGCELALACTFRIASYTARLGQPEVKLGILPAYGGSQRLPRLVGRSAALRLILTAEIVSASEALRIGLVDEVVPAAGLLEAARALALKIVPQAPLAIAASIEAVNQGADLPLNEALALEARIFARLCATQDKHEGVRAFLEKRPAIFVGK